jgi:nickel-dependent lactate racemase
MNTSNKKTIILPYGNTQLSVNIPDRWLGQVLIPEHVQPARDIQALVSNALEKPISSPQLSQIVKPGQKVVIIVDDYTRKTPIYQFLPFVLEHLTSAGVKKADIRIVVALGTHRPMTELEIKDKIGKKIMGEYEIVNLPCELQSEMIFLGTSSNGIPAWVNRAVAEADIRIGLGMITPHSDAGFSGGAKIILPGVCGSSTVNAFHAAGAFVNENPLGNVETPIRQNLERFVAERVPLSFIINVIVTLNGEIYQCVAGDPVVAHRRGVIYSKKVFGVPLPHRYQVVVANSYPYDVDLWQSTKGVFCGDLVVADGGTLIVLTAATEGNSNYPVFPSYIGRDRNELKQKIEMNEIKFPLLAAESVKLGALKERINLVLVSGGLTELDAAHMGIQYYSTIEQAVTDAVSRLPSSQREKAVCVIPQAGITLPLESTV